ncbi:protealysin inhibitor emfourin [Aeromicrobium wangtongii]|uniref:Uncharacterized protein n=1 Tax=Aeromicrobium wangtongii TaxID=2969247 RepID=A0ABY5MDJ0_9ACTN|nr:protealysin inhibitor emfourin [Aeromicrobium wangtongii]MCD9197308.1 hypothetical protein [Aeromicrobium wangtongii]UUP14802.1 hypothetical protein NQV15_05690 [Aeromicrobium wangtongii]
MDELPFVITVVRSGGVAGLRREWSVEVAAPQEADHWRPIVEACPWDEASHDQVPDGFVYDFRVADMEAVVTESDLDGPWRDLAEEVKRSTAPDR